MASMVAWGQQSFRALGLGLGGLGVLRLVFGVQGFAFGSRV